MDRCYEHYVGVPFTRGGHGPDSYNCWGLVCAFLKKEASIELDMHRAIRAGQFSLMMKTVRQQIDSGMWVEIELGQQKKFDVAVMWGDYLDRHGELKIGEIHVGVFVSEKEILHTEDEHDSCYQSIDDIHFRTRLSRVFRHRSML